MEYVRGMVMMVTKAGIASDMSSRGSSRTELNIMSPTMMRTGDVAAAGMARNKGEKNNAMTKHMAMTNAANAYIICEHDCE